MTRPRLCLLVLCAMALGVPTISADAAQAAEFTPLENVKAELVGEKDSADLTLLAKTLGIKVIFTCTGIQLKGMSIEKEGKLTEGGKVNFTGCEAYKEGTLEGPLSCDLQTSGAAVGTIETNELKGQLVLHELAGGGKEVLAKVEPKTAGGAFATVLTNGKCALPESNKIGGVLYLKDCEKKATTHEVKHLVEAGPLTSLVYGGHTTEHLETSLDGSAWVKLGGEYTERTWGINPNVSPPISVVLDPKEFTPLENVKAELVGEKDSADLTLLAKTLGIKVIFTCTGIQLKGMSIEKEGKLTEGGKVNFTGCEAYKEGVLELPLSCHVKTTGQPEGTIETNELKGQLVLHELAGGGKEVLAKVEPKTAGGAFATVLTEKCTLPETNKIGGVLYLKDCEKKATTHEVKHLVEAGPLTSLVYGAHSAEHLETGLDGSAWVKLGGVYTGHTWGINPNGSPPISVVLDTEKEEEESTNKWSILNSSGTTATELKAALVGETDTQDLTLLLTLSGAKMAITCTGFALSGVNLEIGGKLTEGGKVTFTGCEAYKEGTLTGALGCGLHSSGAAAGTIETTELKGELVLHELAGGGKEVLAKVEPKIAGGAFATILTNGKCIFAESFKFSGVVYFKDCEKLAATYTVKHLIEQGPLTSILYGTDSAEHLATSLDGSSWVKLSTVHAGLKWAAPGP